MLGPKNNDLKSISDFNSSWADRIALLILVGLGVDIVAVFIPDDTWRRGLTIAADSLIAIGVWGELRFAKRARSADDSRVAEAEKALAEASIRAAEAHARAAQLMLDLEKEKTARLTDRAQLVARHITAEQRSCLISKLTNFKTKIEMRASLDEETWLYARSLNTLFREAKVPTSNLNSIRGLVDTRVGIIIYSYGSPGEKQPPKESWELKQILEDCGIAVRTHHWKAYPNASGETDPWDVPGKHVPPDAVLMVIGKKPEMQP
jgi:hypothetical protein